MERDIINSYINLIKLHAGESYFYIDINKLYSLKKLLGLIAIHHGDVILDSEYGYEHTVNDELLIIKTAHFRKDVIYGVCVEFIKLLIKVYHKLHNKFNNKITIINYEQYE